MDSISRMIKIKSEIRKVWNALVNARIIEDWSGSRAVMKPEVGFEFKLWGGDIHGKNVEVMEFEYLKQEWYGGDWELPSFVTFRLRMEKDMTILELEHTNLPPGTKDEYGQGWDDYYLGAIKNLLEES